MPGDHLADDQRRPHRTRRVSARPVFAIRSGAFGSPPPAFSPLAAPIAARSRVLHGAARARGPRAGGR